MADEIKWIKLSTGILDDEKIIAIEDLPDGPSLCWMWIKLLALAGRQNNEGRISLTEEIPYTDTQLAKRFRMPIATVQLGLTIFQQYKMIEIIDNFIYTSNWSKYQNAESLEKIKEQARIRKARQRERQKALRAASAPEPAVQESKSAIALPSPFTADEDLRRIQEDHNAILDLAERIGIVTRDWDRDQIIDLYAKYGREVVEYALTESGKSNKKSLKYIEAICRNYGKPKEQKESAIMAAARRLAQKEAEKEANKNDQ